MAIGLLACATSVESYRASQPLRPTHQTAGQGEKLSAEGVLRLRSLLSTQKASGRHRDAERCVSEVQELYAALDYGLPWLASGRPTDQARQMMDELRHADDKGLAPEDYEGFEWEARAAALSRTSPASEDEKIQFDLNLTIATMQFLSDLHTGRVNPETLHFAFATEGKSLDLSEFVQTRIIGARDVAAAVETVEPQFLAYRRTLQALKTYRELMRRDGGEILPVLKKPLRCGDGYAGAPRLARFLKLVGDLAPSSGTASRYDQRLCTAVKHFQERHGLTATGELDRATLAQLNTPLGQRVRQLELTLERWRWLPQTLSQPVVIVNIPEFRLYAVEPDHQIALTMNVVVGRVYRYKTPVFMGAIREILFRPSWNVPVPIVREEFLPKLAEDREYLAENGYEIVDPRGRILDGAEDAPELEGNLRNGVWFLRQKPGPENSLGLIKFEMPNPYDVYLHGTPSQESFAKSRRDFSHGCIRVEYPAALALWILRGMPEWTEERIAETANGEDTVRVALPEPVAVWILYGTATVDEAGEVHFFRDIYGHDGKLQQALAAQQDVGRTATDPVMQKP